MSSSSNPTRSLLPQTQQQNTLPPTKKRPSFFQVLYNNDYYQTLQMQHRNLFSMSKPGHPKPQKVEQLTH
jgi:hypothetical protein